jgi:LysM repeat protein
MAGRSPARFLAPLALVAVVIALFMVVNSSLDESGGGNTPGQTSTQPRSSPSTSGKKGKKERRQPRRYTVKSGDTPSSIADKTGVPLEEILRLNPDIDPQTLSPGQRIKLRQ